MTVPSWVKDSIFYQIFPDRFCNGDLANDPVNLLPWEAKPTIVGFQGGDLRGVIERMYYLLDLGINAIYLNPIFLSPSTHRYNAVDYFQIDPKLGTMQDFSALLDIAHRNQIRVILDGVFNHCGRGFFAFSDILENGPSSPYVDWFHVKQFPLDAYSPGDAENYLAWWRFKSLPKFNTNNEQVRKYIFSVADYWLKQGIDGWRLDVPNEIDDDGFWAEFRQVVKTINPDAYLVGEIWDGDPRWVGEQHFDGLMHYPVRTLVLDFMSEKIGSLAFMQSSVDWMQKYPAENAYAMYNTLGSHDTERILTLLNRSVEKTKLAFFFLLCYPGAPALYYGDEIGTEGGKDPDCRRTFNWDESAWNLELRQWIKALIRIRKDRSSFRRGDYHPLPTGDDRVFAFYRTDGKDSFLAVGNASSQKKTVTLDLSATPYSGVKLLRNILGTELININDGKITIEVNRWGGLILCAV
jgi:cyclomaltodextrinase / maltogenic alpha-amylase / neopullulanase